LLCGVGWLCVVLFGGGCGGGGGGGGAGDVGSRF
jgi:hypothetical protein